MYIISIQRKGLLNNQRLSQNHKRLSQKVAKGLQVERKDHPAKLLLKLLPLRLIDSHQPENLERLVCFNPNKIVVG